MGIDAQALMACATSGADLRRPGVGEAENLAGIAVAVKVSLPRPVTGLAALLLRLALGEKLLVRGFRQTRVSLVVTRFACLRANVAGRFGVVGSESPKAEQ